MKERKRKWRERDAIEKRGRAALVSTDLITWAPGEAGILSAC